MRSPDVSSPRQDDVGGSKQVLLQPGRRVAVDPCNRSRRDATIDHVLGHHYGDLSVIHIFVAVELGAEWACTDDAAR